MKSILYFRINALCAAMLLLLAGCEHKELSDGYPHTATVKVVFDWKNAPDADPEMMCIYFYPKNGGEALRHDFTDIRGGVIKLPVGRYDAICLNSDTEKIYFRNIDKRETFEVYTGETSLLSPLGLYAVEPPPADAAADEKVVACPDRIWSGTQDDIVIASKDREYTVTLCPEYVLSTYTYEIRNAENLKAVTSISGALSGMAGSMLLAERRLAGGRVTLPFEAHSDGASTLTGEFLTFGHCPQPGDGHQFTIYAVLKDGSKWFYNFDVANVTSQIHNAADPRRVHIVLDGLPLPEPIEDPSGMNPSVDGWQDVNVDLEM